MKSWQLYKDKIFILIIVITLIFQSFNHAYGSISFVLLLVVGVIGYIYKPLKFKTYYLWPVLFFLWMALSILWSLDQSLTLKGIVRLLPLVLIPLAFCFGFDITKKEYEKIFDKFSLIYAILALFFIVIGLYNYVTTKNSQVLFYHTLVKPAGLNAIYASSFALVAYFWILLKKYNFFIYQIAAIVLFVFIILLSSKLLITFSILFSLLLLISKFKIKFRIIFIVLITTVIGVLVWKPNNLISKRFTVEQTTNVKEIFDCENFTKVYPWTGLGLRLFQSRIGFEILAEDPEKIIYGLGFNASQPTVAKKHETYNLYPGYYEYNFHNQYLQTLIELGVLGFLVLLICLYQIFNMFLKSKDVFPLLIFVLFLVLFITESYLMRQRGIIFFAILYSLMPYNNKLN